MNQDYFNVAKLLIELANGIMQGTMVPKTFNETHTISSFYGVSKALNIEVYVGEKK